MAAVKYSYSSNNSYKPSYSSYTSSSNSYKPSSSSYTSSSNSSYKPSSSSYTSSSNNSYKPSYSTSTYVSSQNKVSANQEALFTVLSRMSNEDKKVGNFKEANGIKELMKEIESKGIEKFMSENENPLSHNIIYTTDSGTKFFIDRVKVYDNESISDMHRSDSAVVGMAGLIPGAGTILGPLAGVAADSQQNNPAILDNLKINSIGSVIGNTKELDKVKLGIFKGSTNAAGVWTLATTIPSILNEDREVYIDTIYPANGKNYDIPIYKGVGQITIRCIDESTNTQTSINAYVNGDKFISYEEY